MCGRECRFDVLHTQKIFRRTGPGSGTRVRWGDRLRAGLRFVRLVAISIAQYQSRIQHSV